MEPVFDLRRWWSFRVKDYVIILGVGLLALSCLSATEEAAFPAQQLENRRLGRITDLLLRSSTAHIDVPGRPIERPDSWYVGQALIRCDLERRTSFRIHPPGQISFPLRVGPGAHLVTAVGIADKALPKSNVIEYRVTVTHDDAEQLLGRIGIDPTSEDAPGWHDLDVDLSGYAEKEITLTLSASAQGEPGNDWGGFAVPQVLSDGTAGQPPERSVPSVVLISLDTLRVDRLGAFGEPAPLTPQLDAHIRRSLFYRDALSPSNWTLPAHMSLLTGTYEDVHRTATTRSLPAGIRSLAQELQDRGYRTAAFVNKIGWLNAEYGFDRGFELYLETLEPTVARTRRVRDYAEVHSDEPLFLFVHFFEAHSEHRLHPYEAAGLFLALHAPGAQRDSPACEGCASSNLQKQVFSREPFAPRQERAMRLMYGAGVAELDYEVARLRAELRGAGLWDQSQVAIVSDHGEEIGEHGQYLHLQLYPEITRALIAIETPTESSGSRDGMASLPDVSPTLMGILGFQAPRSWQGVDLRQGVPKTTYGSNEMDVRVLRSKTYTILAHSPNNLVLFDRLLDPGETNPTKVPPSHPLALQLAAQEARHEVLAEQFSRQAAIELSGEDEEHLRELGYAP